MSWLRGLPWVLPLATCFLMVVGWLGIARSEALMPSGEWRLAQQLVWSAVALVGMTAATIPDVRILCRSSYALFGLSMASLVVVYCFPAVNGTHRWIRLGPVGFQPSEFAKIAYVMALSRYFMYRENHRRLSGLMVPLFLTLVPVLLILREPDLGTASVFLPVFLVTLYAAGARSRHLVAMVVAILAVLPLLWSQMSFEQRSRITSLIHQTGPDDSPTDDRYHLHQAKQMVALGGFWGSWMQGRRSDQTAVHHVPEAATDSVIAVLAERYGNVGLALTFVIYAVIVWRGMRAAEMTAEPYSRLVACGLVALIGIEVSINTGMMVGLVPITGLSLPFISYGGSGLLAHAIAVGLIMNVAMRPELDVIGEPFRFRR